MERKLIDTVYAVAWFASLAAIQLLAWPCCGQDLAASPAKPQQGSPGVLVMQDGGVLSGTIARQGERYVLTRDAATIEVSAAKVLLACSTLEEAYEQRRQRMQSPSAEAHLALADWCLRYNLLPQAASELLAARGLEPHHPRLPLLQRRLAAAGAVEPRRDRAVRPAAAIIEIAPRDASASRPTAVHDELPPGALEQFTRKVQPILVNSCTASGCHQPGGQQSFQLDRALLRGLSNRRTTMQNLAATLSIIDREQPQLSGLLTVPRRAHGGLRAPVFGPRQAAAFTHLVDWVSLVTHSASSEEQTVPIDLQSNGPGSADPPASTAVKRTAVPPLGIERRRTRARGRVDVPEIEFESPPAIRFGMQLRPWQPRDPFDPEIFNRHSLPPTAIGGRPPRAATREKVERDRDQ